MRSSGHVPGQRHRAVRRHTGERRRPTAGDVEVDAVAQLERRIRGERGVAPGRRDLLEIEPSAAVGAAKRVVSNSKVRSAIVTDSVATVASSRRTGHGSSGGAAAARQATPGTRRYVARVASASSKESRAREQRRGVPLQRERIDVELVARRAQPHALEHQTSSSVPRTACDRDLRRAGDEPVNEPCRAALGAGDPEHGRRARGREQPECE